MITRLLTAVLLAVGLSAAARAGEMDHEGAKPLDAGKVPALTAPELTHASGSELDRESPNQSWHGHGHWGGGHWGGGWGRGWGWGGGGWGRGWGWGGGWGGGWGWGGGLGWGGGIGIGIGYYPSYSYSSFYYPSYGYASYYPSYGFGWGGYRSCWW